MSFFKNIKIISKLDLSIFKQNLNIKNNPTWLCYKNILTSFSAYQEVGNIEYNSVLMELYSQKINEKILPNRFN